MINYQSKFMLTAVTMIRLTPNEQTQNHTILDF